MSLVIIMAANCCYFLLRIYMDTCGEAKYVYALGAYGSWIMWYFSRLTLAINNMGLNKSKNT